MGLTAPIEIGRDYIRSDAPWTDVEILRIEKITKKNIAHVKRGPIFIHSAKVDLTAEALFLHPYRALYQEVMGEWPRPPLTAPLRNAALLIRRAAPRFAIERRGKTLWLEEFVAFINEIKSGLNEEFIHGCLKCLAVSGTLLFQESGRGNSKRVSFVVSPGSIEMEEQTAFSSSFAAELKSQSDRMRTLVRHRGTAGGYREELLRGLLRTSLPERFHVATGFIHGCDRQIDILIYDRIDYTPVFRQGDLVVVPTEAVRGVIEVKTTLTGSELGKALNLLDELPGFVDPPYFKGLFAFDATVAGEKIRDSIASFYSTEMASIGQPFDEITAVAVIDKYFVATECAVDSVGKLVRYVYEAENLFGRKGQVAMFLDSLLPYLWSPGARGRSFVRFGSPVEEEIQYSTVRISNTIWDMELPAEMEPIDPVPRVTKILSWLRGAEWNED